MPIDTHAIHEVGVKEFGHLWFHVNEAAIKGAVTLGVDYTKPETKKLMAMTILCALYEVRSQGWFNFITVNETVERKIDEEAALCSKSKSG